MEEYANSRTTLVCARAARLPYVIETVANRAAATGQPVEIELSVLSGQCLDRRIPDIEALRAEVGAWQEERNGAGATVDWRFTARDAREKLRRIYPATP